jgi:exopolysaccharide biosynthesis protein
MLVVDGRHGTLGMTYAEMASIFKAVGCEAAVNLDGGGSAEMIVRNPVTNFIQICNWPSDPTDGAGGEERPRLNAWAIVKK